MNTNLSGRFPDLTTTEDFARTWLTMAYEMASHSPDSSTQLGAILIGWEGTRTVGVNTPVSGYHFHDIEVSDNKYVFMEHAERNAIYTAARGGFKTENAVLICPWAACHDCARGIVEAGITTVIRHRDAISRTPYRWHQSIAFGDQILARGGVETIEYEGKLNAPAVRLDGTLWMP